MKLVSYSATKRGPVAIGVIAADGSIIDLATAAKKARVKLPFAADDMIGLVAAGKSGLALVKKAVAGLKIGVKKGGCAGMEYTMSWAESVGKFDEVVEQDGARVIIDPQAVLYLLGTEMDYKVEKLASQFVFNNPNQKSACGCGESVNLMPAPKEKVEALLG